MKHRSFFASLIAATWIAAVFGGCGSSPSTPSAKPPRDPGDAGDAAPPPDDGPGDAPDDVPAPPPFQTAAHTPIPLVSYHGGQILGAEQLVTVTFDNEPNPARLSQFDDALVGSPYWHTITGEYCAGVNSNECIRSGVSGGHFVLHETPVGTIDPNSVPVTIQAHILDGTLPIPVKDTVYAMYYPPGSIVGDCNYADAFHYYTQVTLPVPGCGTGAGGAGGAAGAGGAGGVAGAGGAGGCSGMTGATVNVVYAVIMKCAGDDEETLAAGHEFVEAATDPFVDGWFTDDEAYSEFYYNEVGDLCDYEQNLTLGAYSVQRIWSNASARAGHNPCVPLSAGEVYFNAAPVKNTLRLAVGESTTLEVDAYSEAPMADWGLSVVDYSSLIGMSALTAVSIDKSTVNNGTKATVSVKLLKKPNTMTGNALLAIVSSAGPTMRYWPVVVIPK